MAIERKSVTYTISLDIDSIQEIAYSLVADNRSEKAFELLANTYCSPEMAAGIIKDTLLELAKSRMEANQKQEPAINEPAPIESVQSENTN
jgi:Glu-tRNA(Gln) amidotransferase subunit E-like FAD-binding protein